MTEHPTAPNKWQAPVDDIQSNNTEDRDNSAEYAEVPSHAFTGVVHNSDDDLALRFVDAHGQNIRYVDKWKTWLLWDGTVWRDDATLPVFGLVRKICRAEAAARNEVKVARYISSTKTMYAVESAARNDERVCGTPDQWDADDWILNTPGGVVDLRTGMLRAAKPTDFCTKTTSVAPCGSCPKWEHFLLEIFAGDKAMVSYIQRMLGYCLTGDMSEHALFFGWGTGGNGKSVFLRIIAEIMGQYHRTAPMQTFTVTKNEQHPTDVAGLFGARIVAASETEEGGRLAEAKIKSMTGGDKISARRMRQDFFEFQPKFKVIMVGNHKPILRNVDEAMRRRLHLIPFTVTIPPEKRDKRLFDKLKEEAPGILSWMIEGCLQWQREGLNPPLAVRDATDSYIEQEDSINAWVDECCERDPQSWESSSRLFSSWARYADQMGEHPRSQKSFSQALEGRGFRRHKMRDGQGFFGLRLKDTRATPHWSDRVPG